MRICVIGAGIAGIFTSYFLERFGAKKLCIFDREVLASGNTGKSAGIVVKHLFDELDIEITKRTHKIITEINEKLKFKVLKKYPVITASRKKNIIENLKKKLDKKFVDSEILNLDDIRKKFSFFSEEKNFLFSSDGLYVDVGELLYSLYSYLKNKGHEFKFFHEIEEIEIKGNEVKEIKTNRGNYHFDIYVFATGVWTKELFKKAGIEIKVKPYRTQAGIVILEDEIDFPIYNDIDFGIYIRKETKNEIFVGDGTERKEANIKNYNPACDRNFIDDITEKLLKISDIFEKSFFKTGWAGLCLATPDRKPIIGKIENIENLYVICGFNGIGIMRAPALSEILAEAIIDNLPTPKEFSHERFKNIKEFEIKEGFYPE